MRTRATAAGWAAWFGRPPSRPIRDLHLAGLVGVALYAAAALFFSLVPNARSGGVSELFRLALVLALSAAFAVGYRALRAAPETSGVRATLLGYAVALTAAAAVVPAFHSFDVRVYVNLGWQQVGYGVNPYHTRLYETPNWQTDPMFTQQWQFVPCSYGFLFALETRLACLISGPNHAAAVAVWKAAAAATFLALGLTVWAAGRALGRPDAARSAYLVLWNPLLLLHCVSNAHNDLQFALAVAVAVLAFCRGWWPVVFPALAAAGLVKYLSVILVPFFLIASVRRFGWTRTAVGLAAAGALVAACWWPYRDGFDATYVTRMGENLSTPHNSLASAVLFPHEVLAKFVPALRAYKAAAQGGVKLVCWGAFAAFYAALLVSRLRGRFGAAELARDTVLVLFAVILASPKYHAWYLGMVLPLAVWLPPGSRLRRAVLAVGVANMLSFTFIYQSHLLNVLVLLVCPLWLALRQPRPRGEGVTAQSLPLRMPGVR